MNTGTHVHGDAAPAFKLVGARWAGLNAAVLVKVMLAGGTCLIIVWFSAAAQALGVTALALIRACPLLTLLWTH